MASLTKILKAKRNWKRDKIEKRRAVKTRNRLAKLKAQGRLAY